MSGLTPWEAVIVSFLDPQGVVVPWITAEDVNIVDANGVKATSFKMYPNTSGELDWKRYGSRDGVGAWSVAIDRQGSVSSTSYSLSEFDLGDTIKTSAGALLTRHDGPGITVFYSALVPQAVVADLQDFLIDTSLLMALRTETKTGELPNLYLMENRELLAEVSLSDGINLGFEDGYYKTFGTRPGIYIRTDLPTTELQRLLAHEYAHRVLDGVAKAKTLPAWLAEGLSRYYEFDIALAGPRPQASRLRQFGSADVARTAARAGSLFTLAELDRQSDWNKRPTEDLVTLQYAEAYMAIRYLNETYGPLSGRDVVAEIGRGSSLASSMLAVTGQKLGLFESNFKAWLIDWSDPEQTAIANYLAALDVILADRDAILDQRKQNILQRQNANEAVRTRAALVKASKKLIADLDQLSPPEAAAAVNQEAGEYFGTILKWLSLELESAETQSNDSLFLANAMIPEVNARFFLLRSSISNLRFVFNLSE
ncbi:MAG: hypothetical protein O3A93_02065 [Chloroflexi bacterium]|nr:hypothetical protein [Chloroflexota bacterium]MDA1270033.1 hypothetical protein [Chloroflexota bacterium]